LVNAVVWILAKHWGRIKDAAQDPELGGVIGVTITVMDGIEPGSRISAGDPEEVPIEKKNARKR
jgi:hypothetical protein